MDNAASPSEILHRHRQTLSGDLRLLYIFSHALNIYKRVYVYTPPDWSPDMPTPILYLFRGHEREWVNVREDPTRHSTAIEDVDKLISWGKIPPLVAVMPGLNSADNRIPSLGINMVGTWSEDTLGLGTGRFWDYLTQELIPEIDQRFPAARETLRLMAGFSLGGYTVSLLATCLPGYFHHAAMYDGTFMWPWHLDPREAAFPFSDPIWCDMSIFDAALGNPRHWDAMKYWNTTDRVRKASGETLTLLQRTTFWIASAYQLPGRSNYTRTLTFKRMLHRQNLPIGFARIPFRKRAAHTWHWADLFLIRFLRSVFSRKWHKRWKSSVYQETM